MHSHLQGLVRGGQKIRPEISGSTFGFNMEAGDPKLPHAEGSVHSKPRRCSSHLEAKEGYLMVGSDNSSH